MKKELCENCRFLLKEKIEGMKKHNWEKGKVDNQTYWSSTSFNQALTDLAVELGIENKEE